MTLAVWGWSLFHFGWQAPVVAASLALCLRAAGGSPRLRGAAAFAALLLLLVLPGLNVAVFRLATAGATAAGGESLPTRLASTYSAVAPATQRIAMVWLVLAGVMLARWIGGWWVIRCLARRETRPARATWVTALSVVARRIGVRRPVRIVESATIGVPTLIGVRRPVILVPVPAFDRLCIREIEGILAHELAHVRRHDGLANLIQSLTEALLFFHPAVWWVSRRVRHERETRCDEMAARAVGDRRVYARALARLEVLRAGRPRLALAASDGSLIARLERLACPAPDARVRPGVLLVASVTTAAAFAALCAWLLPPTLQAMPVTAPPPSYVVHASDPAGAFTLRVDRGRVVRAVVSGVRVPVDRILQRGDSVVLPWAGGSFALRLHPGGGFSWTARTP